MAAANPDSTDLECPVCLKDFQDPKLLPCTHLVCRNCVLTWLSTPAAQGGCPLCRAPILSSPLPAGKSLDSCMDDLPTDLAVQSVIQIQEFLSSSHVCSLCDGGVAATSYCLQCTVKLCNSCIQKHMRIPCLQNHVVEDLKQLTAERLAETCRMPCKSHADRLVELYCSSHQELICMLCFPTNHRECGEVQAVSDVARQKRAELKDWADRLLGQEARMSTQIQASRNEYKQFQKKAEDAFDDLETILKQQRRTVMADIQTEVEARLTSLSRMEAHRTGLKARAGLVKKLASSASNDALLGMLGRLKRSEQTTTENMEAVAFTFRLEEVARLKEAILSLGGRKRLTGQATSGCSATTTTTTTTTPPAPCMASATLPTSRATSATTSLQPSTAAPAATATLPMSTTTAAQVTATSAAATAATTRTSPAATSATAATTRPSPAATSATAATSAATLATTAPVPLTAKTTSTTTLTAKSTSPQSAPTVATVAKSPQSMVVAAAKSTSTTGEAKAASLQVTTAPAAKVTQSKTPAPKAILPLSTATSAAKATSTTLAAKAAPTTHETKATSTTLAAKAASTTTLMRRAVSTTSLAVKASSMTTLAAKATSTKVAAKPVPTTLAAKATTPATLAAKATSTTATLSAKATTPTTLAAKTPLPQSTATPATLQAPTPSPAAKSTSTTTAAKAVLAKSTANSSAISPPSTATSAAILPQSTATSSATLPQSTATSSAMLPSSTSTQAAAVTSPQTGSTSKPTGKEIIQMLKAGVRVIAGEGWMSKKEDGGGPGTVVEVVKHPISSAVFVKVQWDLTGILGVHRMTEQRGELELL